MIKAILFDMDGVLINSEYHWNKIEYNLLKNWVSRWNREKHLKIIGKTVDDIFIYLKREHSLSISKAEFMAKYDEIAFDIYRNKVTIYPGVIEVLQTARNKNIKIGLCTSSPFNWTDIVLKRFKLYQYLDKVITSNSLKGRGKPFPDIYLQICKELNVSQKECIVIEDSENGISAAKSAGMFCIGFRNGFNNDHNLKKADLIIKDIKELNLILMRNKGRI